MTGLGNKGRNFWKEVKEWDIIIISQTWVEERGWKKIRNMVSKGYRWEVQWAGRKNRKGRAIGGMLVGVRMGIKVEKEDLKGMKGSIEIIVRLGDERWKIMGIYVREDLGRKLGWLRERVENKEEGTRLLIGGDFNVRTGEEGGIIEKGEWEKDWKSRRSRDKKLNTGEKVMVRWVEEMGRSIFNDCVKSDMGGDWTYTGGRGESVIDYMLGDEGVREQVERMKVGDKVDSDHHPLVV